MGCLEAISTVCLQFSPSATGESCFLFVSRTTNGLQKDAGEAAGAHACCLILAVTLLEPVMVWWSTLWSIARYMFLHVSRNTHRTRSKEFLVGLRKILFSYYRTYSYSMSCMQTSIVYTCITASCVRYFFFCRGMEKRGEKKKPPTEEEMLKILAGADKKDWGGSVPSMASATSEAFSRSSRRWRRKWRWR